MNDAIVELIVAHIVSLLEDALVIPVYRSRDAALAESQLPSVVVTPLLDDPSENNGSICWMNWNLSLAVDILTGAGKDSAAHPYRAAVYGAVMADRDMSAVAGVIDVTPAAVEYQMKNSVADVAFVRCSFSIRYRTKHDDITVAP